MTKPVSGAGVQPAKTDPQKPISGVTIKQGLEKTQLASVFKAAIMSATNQESRSISIWDSKDKGGDEDGYLSEAEMRKAIKAIQSENKKTASADKYKGRADKNVENTDDEKNAFYELNNAMGYNWNGKWNKKHNQFKERQNQIETNKRDVEKSMRVMLAGINADDLQAEKETEEAKKIRRKTFGQTVSKHSIGKDGKGKDKNLPEAVQKTLNDNYVDKRIEGTPVTGKNGVTTINFKDGTSVKIGQDGKTIKETNRKDETTTTYSITGGNNFFNRKTVDTDADGTIDTLSVIDGKGKATKTYTRITDGDKKGTIQDKDGKHITQEAFAKDKDTTIKEQEIKEEAQNTIKTDLEKKFGTEIPKKIVGTIKKVHIKFDGSYVVETDKGLFYICKDKQEKDAPWVVHEYEQSNS